MNIIINAENYSNYAHIIPYIRYCAEDKYDSPWELKKRKISDYEFIFITEGSGEFIIDDRTYNVKANNLLLVKPNVLHYGNSATLPFKFLCIHFDIYVSKKVSAIQWHGQNEFYEAVPAAPIKYHKAVLEFPEFTSIGDSSYINLLLRRILNEVISRQTGFLSVIKSIFIDLVVSLFRQKDSLRGDNTNNPEVLAAIKYIKRNYMSRIHLSDLAAHVHLQPTYISGLFKRHTGHTITDFIKIYRISMAKRLLLETDRKMHDIACSAGFYDLHHFSRVFKELEGLTPVQYRQIKR